MPNLCDGVDIILRVLPKHSKRANENGVMNDLLKPEVREAIDYILGDGASLLILARMRLGETCSPSIRRNDV
jgi:hypothetical protein